MMHEHMQRIFDHMYWADGRILELLGTSAGAGQEEATRLFSHLLAAERVWLLRLRGEDSFAQPIWPALPLTDLKVLAAENATGYSRYLRELPEADPSAVVAYTNSRGEPFRTRAADILLHVALHGSYHRGQIASALRRGGVEPVNTDYITYVRELR